MTTTFKRAIRRAWETGHFWSPDNPDGPEVSQDQLEKLMPTDPVAIAALISLAKSDVPAYAAAVLQQHGRGPDFDGHAGPAMAAFLEVGRCPVPDFAPPPGVVFSFDDPNLQEIVLQMQADGSAEAIGSGNWAGCHNIGNFHSAIVNVDVSGLPSFLNPVFRQVIVNVQRAYAGVGLLFRFISSGRDMITGESNGDPSNTDMSFVRSSSGWIGLAIVGQNQSCSSKIWCKFLSTYRGGNDNESITQQWTTLIKHELGHNCGRSHTNGGVMNPSIVNGLPTEWVPNDPSTQWLKGQFGGVPVPIPGGGDTPKPPTPPTTDTVIRDLQIRNAVQDAQIAYLLQQVREIKGKLQ